MTGLLAGQDYPRTHREFVTMFPNNEACLSYLQQLRWPLVFVCPTCGAEIEAWSLSRNRLLCSSCRHQTGSQYASESHRSLLKQYGIQQSMSRKGNCWDNAISESFFHTLKTDLVHHQRFQTRAEAKQAVFEYIEVFYNRERRHSANGYLSPVNYELQQKAA
jgi:predicted RNA-binding Zn-ribbon protein involved in translation (DUF1610 family)